MEPYGSSLLLGTASRHYPSPVRLGGEQLPESNIRQAWHRPQQNAEALARGSAYTLFPPVDSTLTSNPLHLHHLLQGSKDCGPLYGGGGLAGPFSPISPGSPSPLLTPTRHYDPWTSYDLSHSLRSSFETGEKVQQAKSTTAENERLRISDIPSQDSNATSIATSRLESTADRLAFSTGTVSSVGSEENNDAEEAEDVSHPDPEGGQCLRTLSVDEQTFKVDSRMHSYLGARNKKLDGSPLTALQVYVGSSLPRQPSKPLASTEQPWSSRPPVKKSSASNTKEATPRAGSGNIPVGIALARQRQEVCEKKDSKEKVSLKTVSAAPQVASKGSGTSVGCPLPLGQIYLIPSADPVVYGNYSIPQQQIVLQQQQQQQYKLTLQQLQAQQLQAQQLQAQQQEAKVLEVQQVKMTPGGHMMDSKAVPALPQPVNAAVTIATVATSQVNVVAATQMNVAPYLLPAANVTPLQYYLETGPVQPTASVIQVAATQATVVQMSSTTTQSMSATLQPEQQKHIPTAAVQPTTVADTAPRILEIAHDSEGDDVPAKRSQATSPVSATSNWEEVDEEVEDDNEVEESEDTEVEDSNRVTLQDASNQTENSQDEDYSDDLEEVSQEESKVNEEEEESGEDENTLQAVEYEKVKEEVKDDEPPLEVSEMEERFQPPDISGLELLSRGIEHMECLESETVKQESDCEEGMGSGLGILCALAEQRIREEEVTLPVRSVAGESVIDVNKKRQYSEFIKSKNCNYETELDKDPSTMNPLELQLMINMTEVQKKYKQKLKKLSKLNPKKERKKGPGRPRKRKSLDSVKRRLGRPPKNPDEQTIKPITLTQRHNRRSCSLDSFPSGWRISQTDKSSFEESDDSDDEDFSPHLPVPKRYLVLSDTSDTETTPVKRKPGRPRKLPTPEKSRIRPKLKAEPKVKVYEEEDDNVPDPLNTNSSWEFCEDNTPALPSFLVKSSTHQKSAVSSEGKHRQKNKDRKGKKGKKERKREKKREKRRRHESQHEALLTKKPILEELDHEMSRNEGDLPENEEEEKQNAPIEEEEQEETISNEEEASEELQQGSSFQEMEDDVSDIKEDDNKDMCINKEDTNEEDDDDLCKIKEEVLKEGVRVLIQREGHFYAGSVSAIGAPDIYKILLDGERSTSNDIYSREQILNDAILEICPESLESLEPGTRICCYWSLKYRCLYPGIVSDVQHQAKDLLNVDFDDGDNKKVTLDLIRLLPQHYPLLEYDDDPLQSLSKRKRRASEPNEHLLQKKHKNDTSDMGNAKDLEVSEKKKNKKTDKISKKKKKSSFDKEKSGKKKHKKHKSEHHHHKHHKKHKHKKKSTEKHLKETQAEAEPSSPESVSKMAPFLLAQQLWRWADAGYRKPGSKGKVRKEFHKVIQRGDENIRVGDCAVFLSTGRPYIGRIILMWESRGGSMVVRVEWFYHPEETKGGKRMSQALKGGLFESNHADENDIQTISHKCEVVELVQYERLSHKEDVYWLAGSYEPLAAALTLTPGALRRSQQDIN